MFHVFLLEPYKGSNDSNSEPPPIEIEGDTEWEIEEILDSRIYHGQLQYLVRWLGYPPSDDSWLPATEMKNASDLVRGFHERYSNKPGGLPERKRRSAADVQKERPVKRRRR